jgi:DNA-binding protein H-NS
MTTVNTTTSKKAKPMTTTYLDLKAQIKDLEEQAEELRKNEIFSVIEDMKFKISEYGISAEELGFNVKPVTVYTQKPISQKIAEATSDKKPVEPKYANTEGKTWSGRGIAPKWVSEHIATGGKKEDFLIVKSE